MAVTHEELSEIVGEYATIAEQRGDYEVRRMNLGQGVGAVTFTRPQGYSMIKLVRAEAANVGTFVQVAGGGAMNAPINPSLCQEMLDRHIQLDWGGPFVRSWPDGSMTYGTQMTLPGVILGQENPEGFGFLFGMVDAFGEAARLIAGDLVPHFGGSVLDGSEPDHDQQLLVALIGPPPEGMKLSPPFG